MEDRLTIGEISALFNLNVQTLHYYESIGLFTPAGKNPNGHRYYYFDQVYKLASILYLKKMGYSLARIQHILDTRGSSNTLEQMREQAQELHRQWEELQLIERMITRKIAFTESRMHITDSSQITQKHFPPRYYLPLGTEDLLYRNEHFYLYPTIVFYRGMEKQFGAMIDDVTLISEQGLRFRTIAEGSFCCGYHTGPYARVPETFDTIRGAAAAAGIQLEGTALNINIIDQFIENDPEKYITEIQFRIRT